jgi:hypothetical protein
MIQFQGDGSREEHDRCADSREQASVLLHQQRVHYAVLAAWSIIHLHLDFAALAANVPE